MKTTDSRTMMKSICLVFTCLCSVTALAQEYSLRGKVINSASQEPIEAVNVIILQAQDSTQKKIYSTDTGGIFLIKASQGEYNVRLEQFGKIFLTKNVHLNQDVDLGVLSIDDAKMLAAVIVQSQRKVQYADHATYTFGKTALDKARFAQDLLVTLPELQLDPISNTVKSIKGGKILLLINGIEATDNQIKSIAPTHVARVEYYDIPPARWANRADVVVNVITRNPELGYSYGAEAATALTTGFVNGSAYAGYTKGNNDFGFEYGLNMRNYDNRQWERNYDYQLNGNQYRSQTSGKDHFGYTNQDISLRYTRAVPEDYTFQSKFTITPYTYFSDGIGRNLFKENTTVSQHQSVENSNQKYTNPTLDLYYSKNIGKKDELIFNLIGSHYNTYSARYNREWNVATNVDVFNNDMVLKAKQTDIVGEVVHTHTFEKGKLNSGYRISNTAVASDLKNLSGSSQYEVNYLQQYFYTEYSSKWKKLNYRLSMGLTNIYNKSAEALDNLWSITPKVVLSYNLTDKHSLRFTSSYEPNSPRASVLSNNVVQVAPNIVRRGNPYLKSMQGFINTLVYSFNSKHFDLNTTAYYDHTQNYISSVYAADIATGGYAFTYQNADLRTTGIFITGSYKPFGSNVLVLKTRVQPLWMKLSFKNGESLQYNWIQNTFSIFSQFDNFTLSHDFNIPVYRMSDIYLNTNENANHFSARYKYKDWSFAVGMYWIGMPSEYKTKTFPNSLVNYTALTQIYNNKNMFVFGVSYDFSTGKKLQAQKKLNNQTSGAVTF